MCCIYAHIAKDEWKKLDSKARKCVFLGYARKGYRLYDPKNTTVLHSRDVVFNEREFGIASELRYENHSVQLKCHNMEGPTDEDTEESLP